MCWRWIGMCNYMSEHTRKVSDWNQERVLAISRACGVRCTPLSHSGLTATDSSRRPRHHSLKHALPQGRMLSTGRVRSSGRAGLGQPPILHHRVNTWAMVWPNDYPALATRKVGVNKTDPVWTWFWWAACVLSYMPIQLYLLIQLSYRKYCQIVVRYW